MARQRFDTAPEFRVADDSVVIQQVVGSTAPLLELKDHSGSALMSVNSSGQMTTSASTTFSDITATGTISLPSTTSIGTVSSTEIGYIDGVTSAIQTQINSKAPTASPTFTGAINFPNGSISAQGAGTFRTETAAGRGVGVAGGAGDTAAILQFTNTAVSAQWASISATSGVLNFNVATSNFSGNLRTTNTSDNYFGSANGSNFWRPLDTYNNSYIKIGTGGFYTDAANYYFRSASSADLLTLSSSSCYITSTNITLGGSGVNAVSIPYCAMLINRLWEGYPGIQVNNDSTWGPVGEFRVHGYSGISGGDFGVNFRIDGTYLTGSDERMKTNVSTIDNALQIVNNMRGVKYRRINRELEIDINKSSMSDGVKYGFLAQELIAETPELVSKTPDYTPLENGWADEFAVDYGSVSPLLVEAIKELTRRISLLESAA